MAERHVRQGEQHVIRQRETVAKLRKHRQSTVLAEKLLMNLQDLLEMHRQHLARVRLEQQSLTSVPRDGMLASG